MASRNSWRPRLLGYRCVPGSETASCIASTTSAGVGRSGSPMPSEMTSTPAAFFSEILRSSSANRYGGIRSSLLLARIRDLLDELVGELAPEHRDGPAGQVDVQVVLDLDLERAAVEPHGHGAVAPAQDVGDGGAGRAGPRGHGPPHPALEDPRTDLAGADHRDERDVR